MMRAICDYCGAVADAVNDEATPVFILPAGWYSQLVDSGKATARIIACSKQHARWAAARKMLSDEVAAAQIDADINAAHWREEIVR